MGVGVEQPGRVGNEPITSRGENEHFLHQSMIIMAVVNGCGAVRDGVEVPKMLA